MGSTLLVSFSASSSSFKNFPPDEAATADATVDQFDHEAGANGDPDAIESAPVGLPLVVEQEQEDAGNNHEATGNDDRVAAVLGRNRQWAANTNR